MRHSIEAHRHVGVCCVASTTLSHLLSRAHDEMPLRQGVAALQASSFKTWAGSGFTTQTHGRPSQQLTPGNQMQSRCITLRYGVSLKLQSTSSTHIQKTSTLSGNHVTPLHAALYRGHFWGTFGYCAAPTGERCRRGVSWHRASDSVTYSVGPWITGIMRSLIDARRADPNAENAGRETP